MSQGGQCTTAFLYHLRTVMHFRSECWPATLRPMQLTQKSACTFETVMKLLSPIPDTDDLGGRALSHSKSGTGTPPVGMHRRRAVPPRITGSLGMGVSSPGLGPTRSTSTTGGSSERGNTTKSKNYFNRSTLNAWKQSPETTQYFLKNNYESNLFLELFPHENNFCSL